MKKIFKLVFLQVSLFASLSLANKVTDTSEGKKKYLIAGPIAKKFKMNLLQNFSNQKIQSLILSTDEAKKYKEQGYQIEEDQNVYLYDIEQKSVSIASPHSSDERNWAAERLQIPQALSIAESKGDGVHVCVVDTGVDQNHPQLFGKITGGINLVDPNNSKNFDDELGHGTAVASIIAGDKLLGVDGTAPNAGIYVVKAFDEKGSSLSRVIDGIRACYGHANVINMSFGGAVNSQILESVLAEARGLGISLVAAAGNNSTDLTQPASSKSVIAVGSINKNNSLSDFSSRGKTLDFLAPGEDVTVIDSSSKLTAVSGTSFSAAYVAGIEALRIANKSALLHADSLNLLTETQGQGLINARLTIQ